MTTQTLHGFISRFAKDENGSNALEYGLIVGLVSLAIVAGAGAAGGALGNLLNAVGTAVNVQAAKIAG